MFARWRSFASKPTWYHRVARSPWFWINKGTRFLYRPRMIRQAEELRELLKRIDRGDTLDLLRIRKEKLTAILRYAYRHCRYYRRCLEACRVNLDTGEGFETLPLLDKGTIRANWWDIVSDELPRLDFSVQVTGGSTGEPLEFPIHFWAGQVDRVHQAFLLDRIGYQPGDRIVRFSGRILPRPYRQAEVYWIERPHDIPYPSMAYYALYLNSKTLPRYVEHLLRYRPAIIRGYPSLIDELADYILEQNIKISFPMKGILLAAETVYPWQVERITKAFHAPVYGQYGHAELSVFAYTCNESFHYCCSPLYGWVEVVDAQGHPVGPGEKGELVVTGFHNRALPFIRYRTGDLAILESEKEGQVVLREIIGRTQDYIVTRPPAQERISFQLGIFAPDYEALRHVKKWQIIQDEPGKIRICLIPRPGFGQRDEQRIRETIQQVYDVDITFEYDCEIAVTPMHKFRLVIQNIPPSGAKA